MAIHLNLSELLREKQISVTSFAKEIGISRTTAYKYLNGTIGIDVYTLLLVCEKFDAPLSRFIVDNEKAALLKENQQLKQENSILSIEIKNLWIRDLIKEGKTEIPKSLKEFPQYKDVEVIFKMIGDPDFIHLTDLLGDMMDKRVTPINDILKKRKDKEKTVNPDETKGND
jgi:transcriptional regulator with XRE-family HTH domain